MENAVALVNCKECGKEVAQLAKACPHCGIADPGVKPQETLIAALVVAALIGAFVWWMWPSSSHDTRQSSKQTQSPSDGLDKALDDPVLKESARKAITSSGHWCGRVESIMYDPFESSPNLRVFRVFCDDGTEAVNYQVSFDRDFGNGVVKEL
jgi:hypothetical protein